jgi:multiple sugar transport system substrate-binding protein
VDEPATRRCMKRRRSPRAAAVAVLAGLLLSSALAACSGSSGVTTLSWYINPDNGGQAALAAKCTKAAGGRYKIQTSLLPNDATAQREQLVRRLAAKDSSIVLMSLDPPFIPEFAHAGFLRPFTNAEAAQLTSGVFDSAVKASMWDGKLAAAPFWANTQLLWYRKSVAKKAGIDPATHDVTWQQIIDAAQKTGTTVGVQGRLYEGYMVWINALVASAGGEILKNPQAGRDVTPAIDSAAGKAAATTIRALARSRAADPGLSTADEEVVRTTFQSDKGGFMVNWPYVWAAAQDGVKTGVLKKAVLNDIGWARYPRISANQPSRPPLGGISLAVSSFGQHHDFAVEAVRCITSVQSQITYMIGQNPGASSKVYEDRQVRAVFPMADLIRASISAAAPRPQTPYYTDVSSAVVRDFHPPASANPATTPRKTAKLIIDVLHDRVLL